MQPGVEASLFSSRFLSAYPWINPTSLASALPGQQGVSDSALLKISEELSQWYHSLEKIWRPEGEPQTQNSGKTSHHYDVLVVGGGAAGCAVAAGLLKQKKHLRVGVVEPEAWHYYQPGWGLIGAGVYLPEQTRKAMADCIPPLAHWIRASVQHFEPLLHQVFLHDGRCLTYRILVVCPGLVMDWAAIDGLSETLGQNGVTSNYSYELASYTWELVQNLRGGKALFTHPTFPIRNAVEPLKALYLSCHWWEKQRVLQDISVEFCTERQSLFEAQEYVPSLMGYIKRYGIGLHYQTKLVAVEGAKRIAHLQRVSASGEVVTITQPFNFLHVVPPQKAPECVSQSPLANAGGWVEVDPYLLCHPRFESIFSLGDVCSALEAKTVSAVQKQAPVVVENILSRLAGKKPKAIYDGYGAYPVAVEHGKAILAEYGYEGKPLPSFPIDSLVPRRSIWKVKVKHLPTIYFDLILKGHEWLQRRKERKHRTRDVPPPQTDE